VAITLGTLTLDETLTSVKECYEEVGGRDERIVELRGVIAGESTTAAIEARLDALLALASAEDYATALSLRAGRRLWVRREAFTREVSRERLVGAFKMTLGARDPFEESTAVTTVMWGVTASGATLALTTQGNAPARPVITMNPAAPVVSWQLSDGVRTLAAQGTFVPGLTLVVDGVGRRVTMAGGDITPFTSGEFPEIAPGGTTLTYVDDAGSSHQMNLSIAHRGRWW